MANWSIYKSKRADKISKAWDQVIFFLMDAGGPPPKEVSKTSKFMGRWENIANEEIQLTSYKKANSSSVRHH